MKTWSKKICVIVATILLFNGISINSFAEELTNTTTDSYQMFKEQANEAVYQAMVSKTQEAINLAIPKVEALIEADQTEMKEALNTVQEYVDYEANYY